MKDVRGRTLDVLYDLVYTTDTEGDIARKHGVNPTTLTRWKKDPVFQAKYKEVKQEFEKDLRAIPMASKKRRLQERQRLLEATPDEGVELWHNGEIKARTVNTATKSRILNDIKDELEGRSLALTDPNGAPLGSALLDARRQAAKDLEEWEAAQGAAQEQPDDGAE